MYQRIPVADDLTKGLVLTILSDLRVILRQRRLPTLQQLCVLSLDGAVAHVEACLYAMRGSLDYRHSEFNHRQARGITGSLQGLYDNYPLFHYVDTWQSMGFSESETITKAVADGILDDPCLDPDLSWEKIENYTDFEKLVISHGLDRALKIIDFMELEYDEFVHVLKGAAFINSDREIITKLRDQYFEMCVGHRESILAEINFMIYRGALLGGNLGLAEQFGNEDAIACVRDDLLKLPINSLEWITHRMFFGQRANACRSIINEEFFDHDSIPYPILKWIVDHSGQVKCKLTYPEIIDQYVTRFGHEDMRQAIRNNNSTFLWKMIWHQEFIDYMISLGFRDWTNLCIWAIQTGNLHVFRKYCGRIEHMTLRVGQGARECFKRVANQNGLILL